MRAVYPALCLREVRRIRLMVSWETRVPSGNLAQGFVVFNDSAYQRSAMLPVGCHSEAHVDLHASVRGGGEGYCQAVVSVQAVFARVFREELQSE
jgi:hypothetical protein